MKRIILGSSLMAILAGASHAQVTDQQVLDAFSAYDRVEIQRTAAGIKVEAIQGTTKVEMLYDATTGATLRQETERLTAREAAQELAGIGDDSTQSQTRTRSGSDDDDDSYDDDSYDDSDDRDDDHDS
ncbi:MAG: hypothetical protein VX974_12990, partial [Pseudomonadota bacterium]|nr:hypothetical protein [Pseudomonadota bacterium]